MFGLIRELLLLKKIRRGATRAWQEGQMIETTKVLLKTGTGRWVGLGLAAEVFRVVGAALACLNSGETACLPNAISEAVLVFSVLFGMLRIRAKQERVDPNQ